MRLDRCDINMSGETKLVTDTNNHSGDKDQTCTGGLQSYCCSGFKTPPTKYDLLDAVGDAAKDAAEAAAEQLALDVAAKAFCRVAVPALLAPLELIEDLIPFVGRFSDSHFRNQYRALSCTPSLYVIDNLRCRLDPRRRRDRGHSGADPALRQGH